MGNFYATETNVWSATDGRHQQQKMTELNPENLRKGSKAHVLNSAGKIRENVGKDRIVPRLPLEALNMLRFSPDAKDDEPVINIVTGGSFGRQNATHNQGTVAAFSQRPSQKPSSVPPYQSILENNNNINSKGSKNTSSTMQHSTTN